MKGKGMKRLAISLITIVVALSLMVTGVYAAFNDTETNANQLVAGSLDLRVDGENPWTSSIIGASGMKPGDSGVATCTLENVGLLDGDLTADIANIIDNPGTTPEPEPTPDNGELSANMDVVIWVDDDGDGVQDAGETVLYSGKLNLEAGPYTVGALDAGETIYISIYYSIDSAVGNVIQGDSCTFNIVFVLSQ